MTSHCKLEIIPGLEFLACKTDPSKPDSKNHCADTSCCAFESNYKSESSKLVCPAVPLVATVFSDLILADQVDLFRVESDARVLSIPPELPQSWLFISRTALPVRAPSATS